jgi:N-acetylglucosaminyldiphosphoundecaprenol N-acetyl-beta-D-mannosaminyltransferase
MVFSTLQVAGIPFAVTNPKKAADWVLSAASTHSAVAVRLSNAYCVALASEDDKYRQILLDEGINFPDGTPVVWAMRGIVKSRSGSRPERVRGPSLFVDTIRKSENSGLSHFFLGATEQTLDLLEAELTRRFPGASIAGKYSPPYGDLDADFYRTSEAKIREVNPDIIWIGLGTPKQDFASLQLASTLGIPCIGVGAAFDFVAGTVPEAPVWCQRSGLEWLFRLLSEPRRLWRRYLFGNVRFLIEWSKAARVRK